MMKKYKYLVLTILLFIICPNVDASLCSDNAKVNYQSLAKNISSTYEYVETSNTFNIIFTNVASNLYIKNIETNETYNYTGNEMALFNFMPGQSYKFGIYTTDFDCRNDNMYTIYINLPYYNPYYNHELCSGIESYKYCKKFINRSVTYEEFINNVEDYRKKINKSDITVSQEEKGILDYILEFYINNYYIILPIIIVLCLIYRWKYNKEQELF